MFFHLFDGYIESEFRLSYTSDDRRAAAIHREQFLAGIRFQMTKSYPAVLAEWVRRRESTKRDKNIVAFLAVRDDVEQALDAGFAVTTIWANMHEDRRVAFGYDTFLIYVNRYIRRTKTSTLQVGPRKLTSPPLARTRQIPTAANTEEGGLVRTTGSIPGFTFNSSPRKEDLI